MFIELLWAISGLNIEDAVCVAYSEWFNSSGACSFHVLLLFYLFIPYWVVTLKITAAFTFIFLLPIQWIFTGGLLLSGTMAGC